MPLRAGTDIAFLGGLINHVLTEGKEFRDYVVAFTNAAAIIDVDYRDTEDLDGLFSGFDPESNSYDIDSWQYEGVHLAAAAGQRDVGPASQAATSDGRGPADDDRAHGESSQRATSGGDQYGSGGASVGAKPRRDETLQHPRCVFQILKRQPAPMA